VDAATGDPCRPDHVLVVPATSGLTAPRGLPARTTGDLVTAEGLWPGTWRIWVGVPDRVLAVEDFRVEEGQAELEVRVEVPARGTLYGRVEFGDVPAMDSIYVHALGRRVLGGAVPSWARRSDLVGMFPFGSPGREFELPVAPGEYVVEAFGRTDGSWETETIARAVARVRPGERVRVDLRMGPSGHVRFQGGLVPGWVAELSMGEGDGPLEPRDRLVGGGHLNLLVAMAPGTYRWRMRFLADDVVDDPVEAADPLEGTVTVAAGETVVVPVPARARR
jgi:hypothetical protein